MKIKFKSICVILTVILSVFIGGCSLKDEPYNLVITNNSDVNFKSIGFYQENSSGGVTNADSSLIKSGEEIKMHVDSNQFKLHIIGENDKEYVSSEFDVDFETNKNKIYNISIEKDSVGNLEFILNEHS